MNRFPAFEESVISSSPVDEFRKDLDAGFKIKNERCLILKFDFNCEVIRGNGEFRFRDDLAFCLRKIEHELIGFSFERENG